MNPTETIKSDILFSPVTPNDYNRLFSVTSKYGEGSCQLSPVSMFSQREKYGDAACIKNGILFTLRTHLCDHEFRVYLAPLGKDENCTRSGFKKVFIDSRKYGKRVKFVSLTHTQASLLQKEMPDCFEITEEPNLAEYIYKTEKMASFSGNELKKKRNEVNAFWRIYGKNASIDLISPKDIDDIIQFEQLWVHQNKASHDEDDLLREARMIEKQIALFDVLHLSGIVLRIDNTVRGFSYGTKLNEHYYDAIVEKGDKRIPHIYKVLRQESTKQCAFDCTYVNLEEDLGIPGLRNIKLAYKPAFLLHKYIATEKPSSYHI